MKNWTISNAVCQNPSSQKKFFDKSVDDTDEVKPKVKKDKKEKKDKKDKSDSGKKPKSKKKPADN